MHSPLEATRDVLNYPAILGGAVDTYLPLSVK